MRSTRKNAGTARRRWALICGTAVLTFVASGCAPSSGASTLPGGGSAQASNTHMHITAQLTPSATTGTTPTSHTTSGTPSTPTNIPYVPGRTPPGQPPSMGAGGGQGTGSGGQGSGTPTPGTSPTATPGSSPQPTASPTPTPPPLVDDAVGTAISTTGPAGSEPATFFLTVENTGTTTWQWYGSIADRLYCISSCPSGAQITEGYGGTIAPGQSAQFGILWTRGCGETCYTQTSQAQFRMDRNDTSGFPRVDTPFGAVITVTATFSAEAPAPSAQESAPSCDGAAGLAWTNLNTTGNTLSCSGNGLDMRQGTSPAAVALPTVTVSGFTSTESFTHVHVHFSGSDPNSFAGFAFETWNSCGGERFWINANGTWEYYMEALFYGHTTCTRYVVNSGTISPGSDHDLEWAFSAQCECGSFVVDGRSVWGQAYAYTDVPGLTVESPSGTSSSDATFSQFAAYARTANVQTTWQFSN